MSKPSKDNLAELEAEIARRKAAVERELAVIAGMELALGYRKPDAKKPRAKKADEKQAAPPPPSGANTINALIDRYVSDERSPYQKLSFSSRRHYDLLLRRLRKELGDRRLSDFDQVELEKIYNEWTNGGTTRLVVSHQMITQIRLIVHFGDDVLKDDQCRQVALHLYRMRVAPARKRTESLTREQAKAIMAAAYTYQFDYRSVALAQAFKTELPLTQKDIVGEWIPISEPGMSDEINGDLKWVRGLRWEEIDDDLILRHPTVTKDKGAVTLEFDLKKAPLVLEELKRYFDISPGRTEKKPASGAVLKSEFSKRPWTADEFRRQWRNIATHAGIPKNLKFMDAKRGDASVQESERPVSAGGANTSR